MPSPLPLLAGPIVRRATTQEVHVWAATAAPARLEVIVRVAPSRFASTDATTVIGRGTTAMVQLGERLFVHLVRVRPAQGSFPYGISLSYELADADRPALSFRETVRLRQLAYGRHELPTFRLQTDARLRLVVGSCRNVLSPVEDATVAADDVVRATHDAIDRPTAMVLMGDQVYCDSLASDMVEDVAAFGRWLTGHEERLPAVRGLHDQTPRTEVHSRAGFDRGTSSAPLYRFGEFAAWYLMCWNVENWPGGANWPAALGPGQSATRGHRAQMEEGTAALRRLFANIAVYMMFDDHEIHDSWNSTGVVRARLHSNPAGKRIVASGLAAYWAFQGWGNEPDRLGPTWAAPLVRHLRRPAASTSATAREMEDRLWHTRWSFAAPTKPPVLFVDTRSHRVPARSNITGTSRRASQLVPPDEWEELERIARQAGVGQSPEVPAIVVTAVPVLVAPFAEMVAARFTPAYLADSWRSQPENVVRLLSFLARLASDSVMVLSGDLHFGYVAVAQIEVAPGLSAGVAPSQFRTRKRLTQVAASAWRNGSHPQAHALAVGFSWRTLWGRTPEAPLASEVDSAGFIETGVQLPASFPYSHFAIVDLRPGRTAIAYVTATGAVTQVL